MTNESYELEDGTCDVRVDLLLTHAYARRSGEELMFS